MCGLSLEAPVAGAGGGALNADLPNLVGLAERGRARHLDDGDACPGHDEAHVLEGEGGDAAGLLHAHHSVAQTRDGHHTATRRRGRRWPGNVEDTYHEILYACVLEFSADTFRDNNN